ISCPSCGEKLGEYLASGKRCPDGEPHPCNRLMIPWIHIQRSKVNACPNVAFHQTITPQTPSSDPRLRIPQPLLSGVKLPVKLLNISEPTRPINTARVDRLKEVFVKNPGAIDMNIIVTVPPHFRGEINDIVRNQEWDLLVAFGVTLDVYDGNHRVSAAKKLGFPTEACSTIYSSMSTFEKFALHISLNNLFNGRLPYGLIDEYLTVVSGYGSHKKATLQNAYAYNLHGYPKTAFTYIETHFSLHRIKDLLRPLFLALERNICNNAVVFWDMMSDRQAYNKTFGLFICDNVHCLALTFGDINTQRTKYKSPEVIARGAELLKLWRETVEKYPKLMHEEFTKVIKDRPDAETIWSWLEKGAPMESHGEPDWTGCQKPTAKRIKLPSSSNPELPRSAGNTTENKRKEKADHGIIWTAQLMMSSACRTSSCTSPFASLSVSRAPFQREETRADHFQHITMDAVPLLFVECILQLLMLSGDEVADQYSDISLSIDSEETKAFIRLGHLYAKEGSPHLLKLLAEGVQRRQLATLWVSGSWGKWGEEVRSLLLQQSTQPVPKEIKWFERADIDACVKFTTAFMES
uniref:ParB domain-containing protein n=1 Tax=Steinernema glaseri TaxID=37863 RepID=A0A1I7Y4V8_9BILA